MAGHGLLWRVAWLQDAIGVLPMQYHYTINSTVMAT
jgi:hypothetical protein